MSGELTKLKIQAYSGPEFKTEEKIDDMEFTAMFNPTTFDRKLKIEFKDHQPQGASAAQKVFSKIKPQDYSIVLMLDGTGASGPKKMENDKNVTVTDQVKQFMKVCAEYNGENHRPNYALITWGTFVLKTVLTAVDFSYTMFAVDGTPLRAKISATFSDTKSDVLRVKEEKNSSPDLTHVRTVKEGDTLPLMSQRIYGNSKYYLQVAEANELKNFRNIEPGQKLFFPPIEK